MIAVDTNVLVRWLVRDHPGHAEQADQLFEQSAKNSVLLDRVILAELSYVLESVYEFERALTVKNMLALVNDGRFQIPDTATMLGALEFFADEELDFEDAYLLAQYQQGAVEEVWTFDSYLDKFATKVKE